MYLEKTYKKQDIPTEEVLSDDKGNKYLTQSLSKYGRKEQKFIAKIYNIIKTILPKDLSDIVINKIKYKPQICKYISRGSKDMLDEIPLANENAIVFELLGYYNRNN